MRGIPEVPSDCSVFMRRFLTDLRAVVVELAANQTQPPRPVTNLVATGQTGSILIQFTRSDGDTYVLYWNTAPTREGASRIDIGNTAAYSDTVGQSAVTRYYWVTAKKGTKESEVAGYVSATTVALGVEVPPPVPPPAVDQPIYSDERGYNILE